ncbi:MAG: M23 family metallopeptidase [Hyphomonas sp.]|nr:M23 family metallopeptidase [Hyphomonas sp.]
MKIKLWGLMAVSALALSACDVVRVPGATPEPGPDIPEGAPGPPPPTVPVSDPWGEGEEPTDSNDDPIVVDPVDPDPDPVDPTDATDPTDPEDPSSPEDPIDPEDPGSDPAQPDPENPQPDPTDNVDVVDPVDPDPEPEVPVSPPPPPMPVAFEYYAPGDLIPGTGTGQGDNTVYAPNMLFPIKTAATWPQSMVYRWGGAIGGDQCDAANYDIPWRDNFCEKRSSTRNTPMCPTNKVHQGQDIRVGSAADCNALRAQPKRDRGLHEVIAVENGIIQHIGTYSVQLKGTETGNIYSYLHLNMRRLRVSALDTVDAGDTLGFVSNDFGTTPTTFHLHFEIKAPIEGEGIVHVPPYMSLVTAYERREGGRGELVEDDTVAVASFPAFPDDIDIVE